MVSDLAKHGNRLRHVVASERVDAIVYEARMLANDGADAAY